MHLPRTILLGLGPLLSLWASGAQLAPEPADRARQPAAEQRPTAETLQPFLQPVTSLLLPTVELHRGRGNHSAQATLGLEALAYTSLRASVWMVREQPAIERHARLHQRPRLRC